VNGKEVELDTPEKRACFDTVMQAKMDIFEKLGMISMAYENDVLATAYASGTMLALMQWLLMHRSHEEARRMVVDVYEMVEKEYRETGKWR
jgi:hypothetical protein